jgi:hypothetical protein
VKERAHWRDRRFEALFPVAPLVDSLLEESPGGIELKPMAKFPVVRDLVVDRRKMFESLKRVNELQLELVDRRGLLPKPGVGGR